MYLFSSSLPTQLFLCLLPYLNNIFFNISMVHWQDVIGRQKPIYIKAPETITRLVEIVHYVVCEKCHWFHIVSLFAAMSWVMQMWDVISIFRVGPQTTFSSKYGPLCIVNSFQEWISWMISSYMFPLAQLVHSSNKPRVKTLLGFLCKFSNFSASMCSNMQENKRLT